MATKPLVFCSEDADGAQHRHTPFVQQSTMRPSLSHRARTRRQAACCVAYARDACAHGICEDIAQTCPMGHSSLAIQILSSLFLSLLASSMGPGPSRSLFVAACASAFGEARRCMLLAGPLVKYLGRQQQGRDIQVHMRSWQACPCMWMGAD